MKRVSDRFVFSAAEEDSPLGKAAIFVKPAIILISILLIVMSVCIYLEYSELVTERQRKEAELARLGEEIDELKYYISAPMDETYVRKFARERLGLVPADEKIYFTGRAG
ncbi:MAG: septum formation initiator family protein [Clostridia bacterium]|nr:septum formation initiator family protein [Clostridia bacterium]MBP5173823.1 septum formation initiator family protein [Clostridia bacterium]